MAGSAKELFKYFLREKPSMMLIKLRNDLSIANKKIDRLRGIIEEGDDNE